MDDHEKFCLSILCLVSWGCLLLEHMWFLAVEVDGIYVISKLTLGLYVEDVTTLALFSIVKCFCVERFPFFYLSLEVKSEL